MEITDRPSANYTSSIKSCKSSSIALNPYAPIESKFKPCHYSGLTRHDGLFQASTKIYYNLSNRDPIINPDGYFDFYIHIIISAEFLDIIKDLPVSLSPADPATTLTFSPGSEGTMVSQPLNALSHDSIKTFNFHLTNSVDPISIDAQKVRLALLPILSDHMTQGIKSLINDNIPSDFNNLLIRIPIMNPDEIIPFFLRINAFKPTIISNIPKEVRSIITLIFTKLATTLCEALRNYKANNFQSKAILDIALTQWLVVPTLILLFPSQKNTKLKQKLGALIEERMQLVHTATEKGETHINLPTSHLFNKVKNIKIVPGKIAQAERCIHRRKYSTANSILGSFGIYTESGNSTDTFKCLDKLNPKVAIVNGAPISGLDDLLNFARTHPGDTRNDQLDLDISTFFTPLNIQKALLVNTRKNTSAGIDRLSAELLYSLVSDTGCDISKDLLKTVASLFNLLVNSPSYIWRYINMAALHAIPKEDGTTRPIANGTQFRKIFGSIVLEQFKEEINKHYGLLQFAGKRLAAEQFTTITRQWFDNNNESFIIKFDIKNAFNSFLRSVSFDELYKSIPQLGLIVTNIFSMPLPLLFQETGTIDAVLGSQQGCVFGQLLFNFAFQRVLRIIQEEFPGAELISYADDNNTSFSGTPNDVTRFIFRFSEECSKIGLSLNTKKSSIIIPATVTDNSELVRSLQDLGFESKNIIRRSEDDSIPVGIEVLGCPIGNASFIIEYLTNYFDDYYSVIKASKKLQSLHCRWSLAKNSIFCKLAYIIRLTPPEFTSKFHAKIEDEDWSIIESIMQLEDLDCMSPENNLLIRDKAKLKISHGGYSLRDYGNLAKASFLGSQLSIYSDMVEYFGARKYRLDGNTWILDLQKRISAIQTDLSTIPQSDPASSLRMETNLDPRSDVMVIVEQFIKDINTRSSLAPQSYSRKIQSYFSKLLYKKKFGTIIPASPTHSHNWLYLDPSSIKSPVSNNTYTRMYRFDRNVHFAPLGSCRKCVCGRTLDSQEKHLTGCARFGIRARHNNVVQILEDYFRLLRAKPFSGEIQINSLDPVRRVQENIDAIRPSAVLSNIANLSESPASSTSESSFQLLDKVTCNLAMSMHSSASDPIGASNASSTSTSTTNNTECPTQKNNQPGSSIINNDNVASTSIHSSSSTKGTRVDLVTTASWIPLMMDVSIVNNASLAEHEYLQKFTSAENAKLKLHLNQVNAIGYSYFPPIFSTDGSPSKNTKIKLQEYYTAFLRQLNHDDAKANESHGNLTDYFLNKICFEIHRANAEEANDFNRKLVENTHSLSSSHGVTNRPSSDADINERTESLRARYQFKLNNGF